MREKRAGADRVLDVLIVGANLLLPELGKVDGGAEDLDEALVLGLGNVLEGKVVDPAALHETHAADRRGGASQRIGHGVWEDAGCICNGKRRATQRRCALAAESEGGGLGRAPTWSG